MKATATHTSLMISLFALTLAASTGVLLRFGLVWGMPTWATNFTAIRHAHSHLMYFGWVTLALMALIWHFLPGLTGRPLPRGVGLQMAGSALLALLSFPAFWINGYGTTQLGTATLPLGSMAAGLNGLLWLLFGGLYVRATWRLPTRPLPLQLWDWALWLLLLAFGGAVGLVATVMVGIDEPLVQQLALHLFLDLFGLGWFEVALLGALWAYLGQQGVTLPSWLPTQSLALLLVPTFLLGIAPALASNSMVGVGMVSNAGAALLLTVHLYAFWQQRAHLPALARFGLLALAIHIATALVILWPGIWRWSGGTQLRIFFLHNFLLGWVSSTLLALILALCLAPIRRQHLLPILLWIGGVGSMITALLGVGLGQFLPVNVGLLLRVAAWSSLPIAFASGWLLVHSSFVNRHR